MINFKDLKKSSKEDFSKLSDQVRKLNSGETFKKEDNRFWELTTDKAHNGEAIIRFLPPVDGEKIPFVRYWDHGFKGPGGWYIENSRTSLKNESGQTEADPLAEYNAERWAEGENSPGRIFVSGIPGKPGSKRRLHYISNIYVIKDFAKPENNGKVFLFRYGKKIFEHLNELMIPKFETKTPVNPFHLYEGANFVLRACKEDGYRNYNQSEWQTPGPLSDDKTMEAIWRSEYPLLPFLDPKEFKSYDELKRKLERVMKLNTSAAVTVEQEEATPAPSPRTRPEPVQTKDEKPWEGEASFATDDEDDDLAIFKTIAGA